MMRRDGVGWCAQDGMGGAQPLEWSEIESFSRMAGLALEVWESRQIRKMSAAYVEGLALGSEPMRVSPAFADDPDADPGIALERKRISDTFAAGFEALANASK